MFKILIVDDEEDIRFLYRKELESIGYQAVTAGTIEQAKEMFMPGGIDLVILDLKLTTPDSGLEVLRWMRQTESTTPIIINSAYPNYKTDFTTWLANEYLVKSGDLNELTSTVARLLEQKTEKTTDKKD
jgi:DNA-binding response OmpR family regulator